jgi:hypothetical protein
MLLSLPAFVAERAHQWQSLTSSDWSVSWPGGSLSRRVVLATALVIGWGEGLGFYVQSERAFWGMVFWVLVAHVILTGALTLRRASVVVRICGPLVIAAAACAAMLRTGTLADDRPPGWLGLSLLPVLPDAAARSIAGAACAAALAIVAAARGAGRFRDTAFVTSAAASALASTFLSGNGFGPIVFILGAHAIPCFVRNLSGLPRSVRARAGAFAVALAGVEWFLVSKSIWFPDGSTFPDLVDWWDLGHGANFVLLPLWMAPFFAHVVLDAIRFSGRPDGSSAL